jgi:predicted phosphoribosyltransferase
LYAQVLFRDREDAGRRLARVLSKYRGAPETVVLGIPRGGIVVASAIARALQLPLGVCAVHKLGAPDNPELAIGAVDDGSVLVVDDDLMQRLEVTPSALEQEIQRQRERLRRWVAERQGPAEAVGVRRQVIITDDGIATGSTARAAVRSVRNKGAQRVILAVPVAPREAIEGLRPLVDELLCLATPEPFYAVGTFFDEWPQVTDSEVEALLRTGNVS